MPLVQTDYGLIYNTDGTLCATLRPGEGRFGGAVAVEEGTVNGVQNGDFASGDISGWSYWGSGGTVAVVSSEFGNAARVTKPESVTGSFGIQSTKGISVNQGDLVTVHFLVKGDRPNYAYLMLSPSPNVPFSSSIQYASLGNGWERGSYTWTADRNCDVGFLFGYSGAADREGMLTQVQVEKKPFATSFVDGTRADGILRYPDVLSPLSSEGTVSFRWRSPAIIRRGSTQHDFPKVAQMGKYYRNGSLTLWLWDSHLRFMLYNNGWTSVATLVSSVEPERWYDIAITWKNKVFRAFVDGERAHETNRPDLPNEWADGGDFIIEKNSSAHPNALYDELLILPYTASEEEIQGWYNNGISFRHQPGYYAPFDDSIALQTWTKARYDYEVQNNRIIFERAPKQEDHILASYETPV